MYAISCYIGPCHNGTRLYVCQWTLHTLYHEDIMTCKYFPHCWPYVSEPMMTQFYGVYTLNPESCYNAKFINSSGLQVAWMATCNATSHEKAGIMITLNIQYMDQAQMNLIKKSYLCVACTWVHMNPFDIRIYQLNVSHMNIICHISSKRNITHIIGLIYFQGLWVKRINIVSIIGFDLRNTGSRRWCKSLNISWEAEPISYSMTIFTLSIYTFFLKYILLFTQNLF